MERGGGEAGGQARLLLGFGLGGALVNHFDWIKVSEALKKRERSKWLD